MSKRSELILATVFSLIGISEAFGQCALVRYPPWEQHRPLEVRQAPRMDWPATMVERVLKIRLLSWPDSPHDWKYVETIRTTTGGGAPITGWIPASRVGRDTNCNPAYR